MLASIIAIISFSCNNAPIQEKSDETDSGIAAPTGDTSAQVVTSTYKLKTGKVVTITEAHPVGMSLSTVTIGFDKDSLAPFVLTDIDPVNKILVGDLDENGFDEVYIISTAAGSGSAGSVHAFASNKDKSLSMVFLPEIETGQLAKGEQFEGYEGHDEFSIQNNTLLRSFPVATANGTKRLIKYKVKQGEASYQLYIISSALQ